MPSGLFLEVSAAPHPGHRSEFAFIVAAIITDNPASHPLPTPRIIPPTPTDELAAPLAAPLALLLAPLHRPERAGLLGDADLELSPDDHLINNLGKAVPSDSLIVFGKHGSGSLLALWRPAPHTPLASCPVLWFDSEGDPIDVIAPDFAAFLELLPYGLGQIYDLLIKAQRMRDRDFPGWKPEAIEVSVTDLREGLVMIADGLGDWRDLGLPPAADPLAIVERAVALPFAAWWSALPDSA